MEYILPIGSVVAVRENRMLFVITGYRQKTAAGKEYDYIGVQYPHGLNEKMKQLAFNEEEIKGVVSLGYQDITFDVFKEKILKKAEEE